MTEAVHNAHYVILWRNFSITATEGEEALRVEHDYEVDNDDQAPSTRHRCLRRIVLILTLAHKSSMLPRKPGLARRGLTTDRRVAFVHLKKPSAPPTAAQATHIGACRLRLALPQAVIRRCCLSQPRAQPLGYFPAPCTHPRGLSGGAAHALHLGRVRARTAHILRSTALAHLPGLRGRELQRGHTHQTFIFSPEPLSPHLCSTSSSSPQISTCGPTLTSSLIISRLRSSPALSRSHMPASLPRPADSMLPPASYTPTPGANRHRAPLPPRTRSSIPIRLPF